MATLTYVKHAPEFTLEDFFRSLTDKPQYFEFFLNKACAIAKNIGVKEEDKREFALVAIEHLESKLDKFDPSRAEFSSFFNKVIGNKIRDLIKFSRPKNIVRLDDDHGDGIENYGESIFDEGENKTLKKLDFADKLIEELKTFIDTLTPEKRLILCKSEFGKLVMGGGSFDRNYADMIAALTDRTAGSIRKIAERTKKDAIEYLQEKGFDYGTYISHIELITARPKVDRQDFSSLDLSAFSGVQRLKFRMYLLEKAVADGIVDKE